MLRWPSEALRQRSCTVNAMFGASFTKNDAILNLGVQHFEDLHSMFAHDALLCDGAITLGPLGVRITNGPDFGSVVYGSNISNIFIQANEHVCIRYDIGSNYRCYDNTFLFCVANESKRLALHTIPIV
jgi:hypothetical protein